MTGPLEAAWSEHLRVVTALEDLLPAVAEVAAAVVGRLEAGGTVWTFGNGGSAADAQHLVAELVGRHLRERRPLPAVALTADAPVSTCIGNDYGYDEVFSRQVRALVRAGDCVVAFSTSGTSPNVVRGLQAARERGALTVLLTGRSGEEAAAHADLVLRVPSEHTARVQEGHVLLLHLVSEVVDRWAAGE